jgi:cellulose synthase/poly-beta-1,6-N-acetylglucosamine synthase-like glycosyltransferase
MAGTIDLTSQNIDSELLHFDNFQIYLHNQSVPFAITESTIYIATSNPENITHALCKQLQLPLDATIEIFITTKDDIEKFLNTHFAIELTNLCSYGLFEKHPQHAINPNRKPKTAYYLAAITATIALSFYLNPIQTKHVLFACILCFFALMLAFKLLLVNIGMLSKNKVKRISQNTPLIDDEALPIYTILVPLFKEADCVPDIIKAMQNLDYPKHKMDVKLIAEEHDTATITAINAAPLDERFHLVIVPFAQPQTKPRACNYALQFAYGEYVTIYDAEDAPNAQQLRLSASIFATNPQIACLQARLNYYNAHENWLTNLFAIEYAMLFEAILPAFYALKIPIPLGGTSNHLRLNILQKIGGWDCHNVTEDADLGLRLAAEGYTTLPIDAITMEEAPIATNAWVKQRTRWIKGYMQTWGVMRRNSWLKWQELGNVGFLGAHLFIGLSSINYVISSFAWVLIIAQYWQPDMLKIPLWQQQFAHLLLIAGIAVHWLLAWWVMVGSNHRINRLYIFLYPLYFVLHSVAGFRALHQFITNPYHWEKTTHGVSKINRFTK